MTEDAGFAPELEPVLASPILPEEAAPEPELEPDAAPDEPAPDETPVPGGPPQAAVEPPDHVAPPFIPDQGVAEWLRAALTELHTRLRAVERG